MPTYLNQEAAKPTVCPMRPGDTSGEEALVYGLHHRASPPFVAHYWAHCVFPQWVLSAPKADTLSIPSVPSFAPFLPPLPSRLSWSCLSELPEIHRFRSEGLGHLAPTKYEEAVLARDQARTVLAQAVQTHAQSALHDQEFHLLFAVWRQFRERLEPLQRWLHLVPGGMCVGVFRTLRLIHYMRLRIDQVMTALDRWLAQAPPPTPLSPVHATQLPEAINHALLDFVTAVGRVKQWQYFQTTEWNPELAIQAVDREYMLFLEETTASQAEHWHFAYGARWRSGPTLEAAVWIMTEWPTLLERVLYWSHELYRNRIQDEVRTVQRLNHCTLSLIVKRRFEQWWNAVLPSLHHRCIDDEYESRFALRSIEAIDDWPTWTEYVLACMRCYWRSAVENKCLEASTVSSLAHMGGFSPPDPQDSLWPKDFFDLAQVPGGPPDAALQVAQRLVVEPLALRSRMDEDEAKEEEEEPWVYGPIRARAPRTVSVSH